MITSLTQKAKALPRDRRIEILTSLPEKDVHVVLKALFSIMEPNYLIEITHGSREKGKDLVMVRSDRFGLFASSVIVKVGNVTGRTGKDVDDISEKAKSTKKSIDNSILREIVSQEHQSEAHLAILESMVEPIQVTQVYVVIVGKVSNDASERIRREVASYAIIYDLEWLIENLTEYYPQVFFDRMTFGFLESKLQSFEEAFGFKKYGKNISDYFVPPPIRRKESKSVYKPKSRPPKLQIDFDVFCGYLNDFGRRIILVGDPGCGKSTIMAKIAIDQYEVAFSMATSDKPRVGVPILLKANDLLVLSSVDEMITHYFMFNGQVVEMAITGLLVDSLDEIEYVHRELLINKAAQFASEIGCSLIIASRKNDVSTMHIKGFDNYEIQPFGVRQAIKLITNIVKKTDTLTLLKDGINKYNKNLPLVPLSIIVLLDIIEVYHELPASMAELYNRYSELVLGKWDRDKGINVLFDHIIKKRFLSCLAYDTFYTKNTLDISIAEYDAYVKNYARTFGFDEKQLKMFLSEIASAGILRVEENVEFCHRSFLDYYIAFYIDDNIRDNNQLKNLMVSMYFSDYWYEVVSYYIGLRQSIQIDILDAILSHENVNLSQKLLRILVGRLLQSGWHSPIEIKRRGLIGSMEHTLSVRNELSLEVPKEDNLTSSMVSDLIMCHVYDIAFDSTFVFEQLKDIIQDKILSEEKEDVAQAVYLLFALRHRLSPEDVTDFLRSLLDSMKKVANDNTDFRDCYFNSIHLLRFVELDMKLPVKRAERIVQKMIESKNEKVRTLLKRKHN